MFTKITLFGALFAASAQIALAQQPYCLLTAINKFEHPADQQTICCKAASQVQSYIADLCPSSMQSSALSAFKTACQESGYGSCSSSSSSSSSSFSTESATASAISTSAPYPVMYTSIHYDTECSCTKTKLVSSTGASGSTGFATGTAPVATGTGVATGSGAGSGAGSSATGSPIAPVAPSKTGAGSPTASTFAGAATRNVGSVAAGLLAVAGIAFAL